MHDLFSNAITLQLQRHSDHHANATRPYQILRNYEEVPQLPAGYPMMQLISIAPPLWRKAMDHHLLQLVNYGMNQINLAPAKRERITSCIIALKKQRLVGRE